MRTFDGWRDIRTAAVGAGIAVAGLWLAWPQSSARAAADGSASPATAPAAERDGAGGRAAATAPVSAAESAPATSAVNPPQVLPKVLVTGRAEDLVGVADTANEGYVGQVDLAQRPLLRPAEILEAVPGLVITQHSGAGKANQYFLRGFQLDHGTDFAVSLEGVPWNLPTHAHGQGYLDLNGLIPELVDNIEYRKGPYYASHGDFATAGSADIKYVDSLPQGILSVTGGTYGYARSLAADSFKVGGGNILVGFEAFHEDGPWDTPDAYLRLNGLAKYTYGDREQGWSLEFLGMHGKWNATNQVAERAIEEGLIDRWGSLSPTDGGNTERYTLVGEGHERDGDGETKAEAYVNWYDMQLWNDFTYFLNDPVHGDQFEQQDRRFYGGGQASHTFFGDLMGRKSDTTVGVQVRSDDIRTGLFDTEDRAILSNVETAHVVESSVGAYVENRTEWLDKFRTEAGVREDVFNFHVRSDIDGNSGDRTSTILSPKLNVVFGPWYRTEFYVSGGYGYHSNDARGVVSTVTPGSLLPATGVTPLTRAKGGEVGVRTGIVAGLQSTLSLWVLDLKSEEVFDGDTAETVPSGPTRRLGIEFANTYRVTDTVTLDADYSISQARFTDNEPDGEYVPESVADVFQAGVTSRDMFGIKGLFSSLRVRYFGPRALTQDDSVQSSSSTIVNGELGYQFTKQATLKLDVLNLLDTKADDIEYYYVSRLPGEPAAGVSGKVVHPAEPFEARVTFEWRF